MGSSSINIPAPDARLVEPQVKSAKQAGEANASLLPIQTEIQRFWLDATPKADVQVRFGGAWRLGRVQIVERCGRQLDAVFGRGSR